MTGFSRTTAGFRPSVSAASRLNPALTAAEAAVQIVRSWSEILSRGALAEDNRRRSGAEDGVNAALWSVVMAHGGRMSGAGLNRSIHDWMDHMEECRRRERARMETLG